MAKRVHIYDTTADIRDFPDGLDVVMIDRFDSSDIRPDMRLISEPCEIHSFEIMTVSEQMANAFEEKGWTKSAVPKSEGDPGVLWKVEQHVAFNHEITEQIDRIIRPIKTELESYQFITKRYGEMLDEARKDNKRLLQACEELQAFADAPWYRRVWHALTVNRG